MEKTLEKRIEDAKEALKELAEGRDILVQEAIFAVIDILDGDLTLEQFKRLTK